MQSNWRFRRVLLKLSGEGLMGQREYGFDFDVVNRIADEVRVVTEMGVQVSIVIGAGNIFRGNMASQSGLERAAADYMGMLGTVMNALALMDALEHAGVETRVQSAIEMRAVAEPYIRRRAIRHLEKGRVVIFGGGTGNPYFSTDTAAALRATEIGADVLIKATKVDGVYDSDPNANHGAKKYDRLTYLDVLQQRLAVMDSTAVSLCMENKLPILVLNLWDEQALTKAILGEEVGTLVS